MLSKDIATTQVMDASVELLVVRDDVVMFPGEELAIEIGATWNDYFLDNKHFALMYANPDSEEMLYGVLCEVIVLDRSINNKIVVYARGTRRVRCALTNSNLHEFIAPHVTVLADTYGTMASPSSKSCFGFPSFVSKSLSVTTLLRKAVSMFNANLYESDVNVSDCNTLSENIAIVNMLCTHLPITSAEKLALLKAENTIICLHLLTKYLQKVSHRIACRKCRHAITSSKASTCLNSYTIKNITVKDKLQQVQQVSAIDSSDISLISNSCTISYGKHRYLTDKMVMCSGCFNHLGWLCNEDKSPVYYLRTSALCSVKDIADQESNVDDVVSRDYRRCTDDDDDDDDDRYSERDIDIYTEDEDCDGSYEDCDISDVIGDYSDISSVNLSN